MAEIRIVDAEPRHLDAILALTAQTCETHNSRKPLHFPAIELAPHVQKFRAHFGTDATKPQTRLFAVLDGDTVVGHVFVTLATTETPGRDRDLAAVISDISLLPDHRGAGLGRRALDHVVTELRAMNVTRVSGYVWFDNLASSGLFDAAGFSRSMTVFEQRLAPPQPALTPSRLERWQATLLGGWIGRLVVLIVLTAIFVAIIRLSRP